MKSLGRCQGQVGLWKDCIIKNPAPEKCPGHPQDQEAPSAGGLLWTDSQPLEWALFCGPGT